MIDEFIKWIGFIGSIASLIGLPIAIWQIYKTRRAAEAATNAAKQTQKIISRNLILSDVSNCTRNLEEVKQFVRSEKYEFALIRVNDSISQLIHIREMLESSNQPNQIQFKEILSQLSIIRESFEKKLLKNSAKIDIVQTNSKLSQIADDLNKIIGERKITIEKNK